MQPVWILVLGVVGAGVFALAGIASAGLAALRLKKRVDTLLAAPIFREVAVAQTYGEQLNATLAQVPSLLERARVAFARLKDAAATLKMPQAILALRTAGVAIRLLVSGR